MKKDESTLTKSSLEKADLPTKDSEGKSISEVAIKSLEEGVPRNLSKEKINESDELTPNSLPSSKSATSSKAEMGNVPLNLEKTSQGENSGVSKEKPAGSGEKKNVLESAPSKGKPKAKPVTKTAPQTKACSTSKGKAPPKERKAPLKESAPLSSNLKSPSVSNVDASEIESTVSALGEKKPPPVSTVSSGNTPPTSVTPNKPNVSFASRKAEATPVASHPKVSDSVKPSQAPQSPPAIPAEFLDPDHDAMVRAARLRLKALYREEDARMREEEKSNHQGFDAYAGNTSRREEPSLLGRGFQTEESPNSSEDDSSYSNGGRSPYVDSASYGKEDHRSLFSRIKDAVLTRITRIQGIYAERAKRGELSQAAGQAEERRHQRKNLAIVLILVGVVSGSLVFLGGKTRPEKKPEVKILKNDFKLSPDTLEKQSFQRQYGEKLEAMDANMKSLQATLEQLDARLKREQEKAKSLGKGKAPITGAPTQNADPSIYVNPGFGRETQKKEKPRMARLTVSAVPAATSKGKDRSTLQTSSRFPLASDGGSTTLMRDEPLSPNRAKGQASYLPAGSFASAVVLSGVTAPTGAGATSNPVPMLLELTDLAQLPNDFKAQISRCFVTANATGDLSSERVWIRLDRLSCMRRDARAIDVKVRGYVTGEDGKTGVRARVVTRSGQAIANALLLGTISGFGSALSASATQSTTYTSGSVGTKVNNPWRAGAGEAIKDATDRLVDYYIKLADKIFPVLELDSGRKVDVVLSQGVSLGEPTPTRKDTSSEEATPSGPQINSARTFGESLRGRRNPSTLD